jgi:hypothetical protein
MVFKCEEHQLVQNISFQVKGRSTVFLVRKPSMLEAGGSSTLLPLRIELACERNTGDMKAFSSERIIHFLKNTVLI